MATINELMSEMQDKYYLRSSLAQIERSVKLFNELDGAMLDRPASQRNESIYLKTVRLLVNQHIAAATYFASPVDLKNLNNSVRNLLQDFENIMQARHEEAAPNTPRVPFNGEYAQAMDIIAACAAPYNKPIYEVWADRIMKGSIDLSVVRADVNNIYNNSLGVDLSTNEAAKENVKAENGADVYKLGEGGKCKGYCAACFDGKYPTEAPTVRTDKYEQKITKK